MLMLIGKGGEGKSRIGLVMRSLLGDSINTTSIQKVESNRFSRADLENKLLMVDDDMDMSALPKTNYIKSIVTSECKMNMERKGVQSYQSQLYVRFLCFGNGALTALHDKSDGFFRRQIVLTTKDRPADRADDPFLVDKLLREKEGIFLVAADSRCTVKHQATLVNMCQSIFCKFGPLILNSDVPRIIDDHHATSMNESSSSKILGKSGIEQ